MLIFLNKFKQIIISSIGLRIFNLLIHMQSHTYVYFTKQVFKIKQAKFLP